MKAGKSIGAALDRPDPKVRLYLFYGHDEAQSRALAMRLLKGFGAERFVVAASAAKADPALIADEAGAMSLFGGKRVIWIEPAGDEIADAAQALLEAAASESPAIAIAGALRKTSALVKLADGHPLALSHIAYVPEGRDAEAMINELARAEGLRLADGVAGRIAGAAGNDRAIAGQELAKLALYLDAAPDRPRPLDHDALDAVGAAMPEGNFLRLADMALAGDLNGLGDSLSALSPKGAEAVPVLRSLQRRLIMLAPLRARVEAGQSPDAVMTSMGNALFWKDKPLVGQMLKLWDAAGLTRVADRAGRLERELMFSAVPKSEALGEELVAIAIQARRR